MKKQLDRIETRHKPHERVEEKKKKRFLYERAPLQTKCMNKIEPNARERLYCVLRDFHCLLILGDARAYSLNRFGVPRRTNNCIHFVRCLSDGFSFSAAFFFAVLFNLITFTIRCCISCGGPNVITIWYFHLSFDSLLLLLLLLDLRNQFSCVPTFLCHLCTHCHYFSIKMGAWARAYTFTTFNLIYRPFT